MEKSLKTFPFWELAFLLFKKVKLLNLGGWLLRRTSQKVLMYSLFLNPSMRKKIEVKSRRGEGKEKILCFRVCFRKINILVESWKLKIGWKEGKNLCESFTREDILSFKKCLDNGNLWFLPFSFQWLHGHTFWTENQILIWSYSKRFWSVLARFLKETQA